MYIVQQNICAMFYNSHNKLDICHATCMRHDRFIIRDLNLSLNPSSILVISGKNGSGKSTLLKNLMGLRKWNKGKVNWNGRNISKDKNNFYKDVIYLGHKNALNSDLTVSQHIKYWQLLNLQNNSIKDSLDSWNLLSMADKPSKFLSKGQARRLALLRFVVSKAPLWVLDEPTDNLDRDGMDLFLHLLNKHRQKQGIIIMAMHQELSLDNVIHLTL
ncbi:MAG: heme ABC exporter ATP-binding protein CcmA [Alphaproteobacteria bacterium]|nr:heme ABC exporter ATP-binding protein CcmA [Alphaproteobacteria bacterium]